MSELRDQLRKPLLKRIDARYLAPKDAYKLYKKTSRGETIQVEKFRQVARPVIEEVLDNPTRERVTLALREMQTIAKKRRGHHRACWAKDEEPHHGKLIYGGRLPGTDSDSSASDYVPREPESDTDEEEVSSKSTPRDKSTPLKRSGSTRSRSKSTPRDGSTPLKRSDSTRSRSKLTPRDDSDSTPLKSYHSTDTRSKSTSRDKSNSLKRSDSTHSRSKSTPRASATPTRRSPRGHVGSMSLRRSPRKHDTRPPVMKRRIQGKLEMDSELENGTLDVESLFESDNQNVLDDDQFVNTVDPTCWDCNKSIREKTDCFPQDSWGSETNVLFRCKVCWGKHCEDLTQETESTTSIRVEKKKQINKAVKTTAPPKTKSKTTAPPKTKSKTTAPPKTKSKTTPKTKSKTTPKTKSKTTPKTKSKTTPKTKSKMTPKTKSKKKSFDLGDNVMSLWTDGKKYPAQIFGVNIDKDKTLYNVYFPQDGEVLHGVEQESLSHPQNKSDWSKMTRKQFLEMEFEHKEHRKGTPTQLGKYKVVDVGQDENINKYVCETDNDDKKYLFDMGYVQCELLLKIFPFQTTGKGDKPHDKHTLYE